MPTPARRPKRSPRRLRKFYAMIVKVFTLARVAKLADARDLKSDLNNCTETHVRATACNFSGPCVTPLASKCSGWQENAKPRAPRSSTDHAVGFLGYLAPGDRLLSARSIILWHGETI